MPILNWEGGQIELEAGETALDALLRAGAAVAHSCRAGICQSCLLRAAEGMVPSVAQAGLKPSLVQQGYFLSCMCRPDTDLTVTPPGAGLRTPARLVDIRWLSESVLRVALKSDTPLHYRPGQYLTLFRADGLGRSYSIASLPAEDEVELHVRVVPNGQMGGWLATSARSGMQVETQGPLGNCFYTLGAPEQALLLAGTGTGLAPLYGIVRDALSQGHTGPIWLYHGALNERGLYLVDELKGLMERNSNFHYRPALLDRDGPLQEVLTAQHPKLNGWRGFVCGDPIIVSLLRKRMFLAGISSKEIYSDSFVVASASR